MRVRVIIIVLVLGIAIVSVSLVSALARVKLFGNNEGYRPEQPLAYSHRVHAGELAIPCLYCHPGAERSRHAGIPSPSMCMNCHRYVTATLGAIREEERLGRGTGPGSGGRWSHPRCKCSTTLWLSTSNWPRIPSESRRRSSGRRCTGFPTSLTSTIGLTWPRASPASAATDRSRAWTACVNSPA